MNNYIILHGHHRGDIRGKSGIFQLFAKPVDALRRVRKRHQKLGNVPRLPAASLQFTVPRNVTADQRRIQPGGTGDIKIRQLEFCNYRFQICVFCHSDFVLFHFYSYISTFLSPFFYYHDRNSDNSSQYNCQNNPKHNLAS